MLAAIALAFGLAMDATAVAATRGLLGRSRELVILPLLFGVFQGGMSALGWLGARAGGATFEAWDHWIAFGLLLGLGAKLLYEALTPGGPDDTPDPRTGLFVLLGLAVATSIDAAAAGVTLPTLDVEVWVSLLLIGVITAVCSALGYVLGRRAGAAFGPRLEVVGGVVLIGLGVRVLIEHLG